MLQVAFDWDRGGLVALKGGLGLWWHCRCIMLFFHSADSWQLHVDKMMMSAGC